MNKIPTLVVGSCLAGFSLIFTACESGPRLPAVFRERIAPTYRKQVVTADQKTAYNAARVALRKMNFNFTSGAAAHGKLEALGSLQPGETPRGARQTALSVRFAKTLEGSTEVSVLFSEIREDEFSKREGMGTTTPMHDTPLYEVFFRHLSATLAQPAE